MDVTRRWLALYPRAWRARYGAEVAGLVDELVCAGDTTAGRARLDLVAGAAIAWWQVLVGWGALASGGAVLALGCAAIFSARPAGPLPLLVDVAEVGWLTMEVVEFGRGRVAPDRGYRWALGACFAVTTAALNLAPFAVPGAAIRPGPPVTVAGIAVLLTGMILRGWSFRTLGRRYAGFTVAVSPDQPLIDTGPYRVLRHPAHAGSALVTTGIGLTSANWLGLLVLVALPAALVLWRTRVEEAALVAALGDRYRRYAASRKRLVPLVW